MTKLSDSDLLNVALGIDSTSPDAQLLAAKTKWNTIPDSRRDKILYRRHLRKEMFGILKRVYRKQEDQLTVDQLALKEIIDVQLDPNLAMVWDGFTFVWDVHPQDGPIVVRREQWGQNGGQFDELGQCFPSAFTKQAID
jgi:hypothetical protein